MSTPVQQWSDKDPDSEEVFQFDFNPMLRDGDTVASIVSIGMDQPGDGSFTISNPQLGTVGDVANVVSVTGTGGTRGRRYRARARVRGTLPMPGQAVGELLDLSADLYIADQ